MNIVILGAGKTGLFAASLLSREGYDVTLIDPDAAALEKASGELEISTRKARIPDLHLFEELAESKPDLLFAATENDEVNFVSCAIAKTLGFPKTVALVLSSEYLNHSHLDLGRLFHVDYFLAADLLAAQDLLKVLVHSGDVASEHFAHGAIQMRTLAIPKTWNKSSIPLKDLNFPEEFIVGLIRRQGTVIFPHGNDQILPEDEVTVLGEMKVINHLHELLDLEEHAVRSIILVGGSPVAMHLAELLLQQKIAVRIIEKDRKQCEALSDSVSSATMIHGDGCDRNLLLMEQAQKADALVCCTSDDASNLLTASLAKQIGCEKTVSLLSDPHLAPVLEHLGIIPAWSARLNVTSRLLSILHEKAILSVRSICNDAARIVELKISPRSRAIGIPLSDLSNQLPQDLLIAVIESQGKVMIGRGNRILCPNDTVILITAPEHLASLQEIFCE